MQEMTVTLPMAMMSAIKKIKHFRVSQHAEVEDSSQDHRRNQWLRLEGHQ